MEPYRASNKDIWAIIGVIAAIVVLGVLLVWTAQDNPEAPLDTDPVLDPGGQTTSP